MRMKRAAIVLGRPELISDRVSNDSEKRTVLRSQYLLRGSSCRRLLEPATGL